MKLVLIPSLLAAVVLVAGCQHSGSHKDAPAIADSTTAPAPAAPAAPAAGLDTAALVAAFRNADIPSNQLVQSVVSALPSRDYSGALAALQKLSRIPGLTAPQADSVHQLIAAVGSRAR